MGCGSSSSGALGQAHKEYLSTKEKVKASPSYSALLIFYNDLYPLAQGIIKKSDSFDQIINQLEKFADVIEDFKNVGPLAPLADVLSILPLSVKPALQATKPVLINMEDQSKKFLQKYKEYYQKEFKNYFDLIKQVENKKSKLAEPNLRYQHGKLIIEYGRYVADEHYKIDRQIDPMEYVLLVKFIQALDLIDKISKEVSRVGDLTKKEVPLTGKKVRDFFESGGSNPVVDGVKKAIEKASTTIEQNVKKVQEYISKVKIYKYPDFPFKQGQLMAQNKNQKGVKINLIKNIPNDFIKKLS